MKVEVTASAHSYVRFVMDVPANATWDRKYELIKNQVESALAAILRTWGYWS